MTPPSPLANLRSRTRLPALAVVTLVLGLLALVAPLGGAEYPASRVGALLAIGVASRAEAYVGPGAGITLIGALFGLVSAVFLALLAVLRWPLRRYLARRKAAQAAQKSEAISGPPPGSN